MKRKQIIVLGLVLVIITVGILQYNSGGSGDLARASMTGGMLSDSDTPLDEIPGAAVYVSGDAGSDASTNTNPNTGSEAITDTQTTAQTGFFAQAKMDRDKSRSKQKEELKKLSENADPVNPASLEAQEKLLDVISRSEIETTVETLIKQRGFEDVLVYMSDTGNIDVIVKAPSLSSKEVAHISDIVVRHAEVSMDCITVKNVE